MASCLQLGHPSPAILSSYSWVSSHLGAFQSHEDLPRGGEGRPRTPKHSFIALKNIPRIIWLTRSAWQVGWNGPKVLEVSSGVVFAMGEGTNSSAHFFHRWFHWKKKWGRRENDRGRKGLHWERTVGLNLFAARGFLRSFSRSPPIERINKAFLLHFQEKGTVLKDHMLASWVRQALSNMELSYCSPGWEVNWKGGGLFLHAEMQFATSKARRGGCCRHCEGREIIRKKRVKTWSQKR